MMLSSAVSQLAMRLHNIKIVIILQIVALWPLWKWYWRRMLDGSDEPVGPIALILVLVLLYTQPYKFLKHPRSGPLLLAAGLTLLQALVPHWPPLVRGLLGISALGLCLAAFLAHYRNAIPLFMLLGLSLPIMASLQFYAGYPLRLLAAHGSSLIFNGLGLPVMADGASLRLGSSLVFIDAPCSGIHMLWTGWVVALVISAWSAVSIVRLILNISAATLLIIFGNILRNTLLFIKESGLVILPEWTHEAIGVLVFAFTLIPIIWLCKTNKLATPTAKNNPSATVIPSDTLDNNKFWTYYYPIIVGYGTTTLFLLSMIISLFVSKPQPVNSLVLTPDWPGNFYGYKLIRMSLSKMEQDWLRDFPGIVARFDAGPRNLLVRYITRPTRMVHSATECYRGAGYNVTKTRIKNIMDVYWSCFEASKNEVKLSICERIYDEHGGNWTDSSAWYWQALWQQSVGPWWALTVIEPMNHDITSELVH